MFPGSGMGFSELLIVCLAGLFSVGLPVAVLVLLVLIYRKLESIENLLKKQMRFWDELSPPWQACMDLAWEAYCDDCFPIGAVVVSADGDNPIPRAK